MKMKHSFGVDFLVRKCKGDKQKGIIYARVTVNEERKEVSLGEKINVSDWDNNLSIIKGRTTENKALNQHIKNVEFSIRQHYRNFLASETQVSAEGIINAYLGVQTRKKEHKLIELLEFYKKVWEPKLAQGNFKNYRTTIDYIKKFLSINYAGDMNLSEVNNEFLSLLEMYIREHPSKSYDRCEGNGLGKHVQRFKRIMNWAEELNWVPSNAIEKYSCPIKKSKRKKLSMEMLVLIESKNFTDSSLAFVKDLFLFSCYTGLAFVDAMQLTNRHFEWDTDGTVWCKLYRTKSDEFSPVPLLPSAAVILEKYKSHNGAHEAKVFPQITNQYVNRSLKIISEICDIQIPLTFHVARHTFGKTVALKNGVPLETVQMMMGHAKISTTQIYADVDEEKIVDDMSTIEEKMNKKRTIVQEKYGLKTI